MRDAFTDIEHDLITHYRALNKYDPVGIQDWYRRVAGWLIDLPDDAVADHLKMRCIHEMCTAHPDVPPLLAGGLLDHYVHLELHTRRVLDA